MSSPISVFRQWVEQVTSLEVIYPDDPEVSAPRPSVAYASVSIEGDMSEYATAYERTVAVDGDKADQYRSQVRSGTLAVEVYGPGAEDYCRALDLSRDHQATLDLLDSWGDVAINGASEVRNDPVIRSAIREADASITFQVQWVEQVIVHDVPYVASVDSYAAVDDMEHGEYPEPEPEPEPEEE